MKYLALTATALLLTACGGTPSEKDIRAAIDAQHRAIEKASGNVDVGVRLHDVEKIGCQKLASKRFSCDVQIDQTSPIGGRRKQAGTVVLIRSSDGWRVSR